MSRSIRRPSWRPLSRETTRQRRIFARLFRARCRAATWRLSRGLDADMPRWRGTCGWMSW